MNAPAEKKCQLCLDGFFGSSWESECEPCRDMKTNFPSIMRWVVGVVDRRVKAALEDHTARPKCDGCGRHPNLLITTGKGTFCEGCVRHLMDCEICAERGWIHPDDGSGHPCCGGHSGHLVESCPSLAGSLVLPPAGSTSLGEAMDRGRTLDVNGSVAIGNVVEELGRFQPNERNVAIGHHAQARGPGSVAIGPYANAPPQSFALAWGDPTRQITIGPTGKVTLDGLENPDDAAVFFWAALEEFNPLLEENRQVTKKINELLGRLERIRHLTSKAERTGAVFDQIGRLASTDEPLRAVKEFPNGVVSTILADPRLRTAP